MAKSQYLESVPRNVRNTKTNTKAAEYNSQLIYLEGNNINPVNLQSRRALKGVIQQYHHRFESPDEK